MSALLLDRYFCDLCPRLRPDEPRACGIRFIDGYWACESCRAIYASMLRDGSGSCHARA